MNNRNDQMTLSMSAERVALGLPAIRVYVAGPLFGSGRSTANLRRALHAAERLRVAGLYPFVPHLFHTWDTVFPHDDAEYWLDMDRVWLESCDVMVRLTGESPGSMREEKWCKELGIPVYFEGVRESGIVSNGISTLISGYADGAIKPRNKMPGALETVQREHKPWADHNFGPRATYQPLLGVIEEIGELAHAHLKQEQNIRDSAEKHIADAKDAIGDAVIFLADYCTNRGFDFETVVRETWERVKKRDFIKDRLNGGEKLSAA